MPWRFVTGKQKALGREADAPPKSGQTADQVECDSIPDAQCAMAARVVLITGCSSGIGLSTAVLLAKDPDKRFKVYATMRNLAKKDKLEAAAGAALGDTLFIKQLDVCSDQQTVQVVQEIDSKEGRVDILSK